MAHRGGVVVSGPGRVVVAVDGPSGSGKSSVSRAAARELGFDYLDTGAAYRSLAWLALERGVDMHDAGAVLALLDDFDLKLSLDPERTQVGVGEVDVSSEIRGPRVSAAVSSVARIAGVREWLNERFRMLMEHGDADAPRPGIITEGRDITTIVAPDADVRVLLTADESVRQGRRAAELDESAESVAAIVTQRDAQDLQVVDFINAAPGVTVLDSTDLSFDETVAALVDLVTASTSR